MEPGSKQFRKRNAILSCLQHSCDHPSAEMVHSLLRDEHPDISLATVYRNLAWFRSQGLIWSLGTVHGAERFDANLAPHAHFICLSCGAVTDLPQVALPFSQGQEIGSGLEIEGCQLTYTGRCTDCRKNRISRESES